MTSYGERAVCKTVAVRRTPFDSGMELIGTLDMKDFLNKDLAVGDFVVSFESKENDQRFTTTRLITGTVTKLTATQVTIVNSVTQEKFRRAARNVTKV